MDQATQTTAPAKIVRFYEVKNSSNIAQIGYDEDEKKLLVLFTSGTMYAYPQVEGALAAALMFAQSVGKAFHALVRPLECEKLTVYSNYYDHIIKAEVTAS